MSRDFTTDSLYTVPYTGFNIYTLLLLSPHKRVIVSSQRIWPPLVFHSLKNTEMWAIIKDLMSMPTISPHI